MANNAFCVGQSACKGPRKRSSRCQQTGCSSTGQRGTGDQPRAVLTRGGKAWACATAAMNISMQMRKFCGGGAGVASQEMSVKEDKKDSCRSGKAPASAPSTAHTAPPTTSMPPEVRMLPAQHPTCSPAATSSVSYVDQSGVERMRPSLAQMSMNTGGRQGRGRWCG